MMKMKNEKRDYNNNNNDENNGMALAGEKG